MSTANTEWAWPWWQAMVIVNMLNLSLCAFVFQRSLETEDGSHVSYGRWMRIMGVIFTVVAAYRSVFVSRYFTQMAWFDSIANSSLLIRLLAMTAELSFAGLIAFAMLKLNEDFPEEDRGDVSRFWLFLSTKSPYLLLLSIFLAQFFATGGLIFKSQALFAIEETLWTLGFLSVLPLAIMQYRRVMAVTNPGTRIRLRLLRKFVKLNLAWGVIYCSYGLFYHLPLENWPSAIDQLRTGLPALKTGWQAVVDAFTIVHESKAYSDWGFGFLLWHSAYFSICVWIAIFLMQAPRMLPVAEEDQALGSNN
ncbi:MAG: hypothetical protein K9M55_10535 [Candidatus Marinimicrobia bacterium]|nr:hypothetical protein [Candidatus Neomarinimicrobiota bacterium]